MSAPTEPREASPPTPAGIGGRRLDSWKEIAAHLGRDIRTVQRWERREGLPVYRQQHDKLGSVYAFAHEIDAWRTARSRRLEEPPADPASGPDALTSSEPVGLTRKAGRSSFCRSRIFRETPRRNSSLQA
jgi:hypothetical protein